MIQDIDMKIEERLMDIEIVLEDMIYATDNDPERRHLMTMYRDCLMVLWERRARMEEQE